MIKRQIPVRNDAICVFIVKVEKVEIEDGESGAAAQEERL